MSQTKGLVESLSGIRGVVGEALTTQTAEQYAHAFAQYLQQTNQGDITVVVGCDARPTGLDFIKVFTAVFIQYGFTVCDIGVTTTPIAEFSVRHCSAQGGVMITASHNPPEYNGWKLLQASGAILDIDIAEKIIAAAHAGTKFATPTTVPGTVQSVHDEVLDAYVQDVLCMLGPEQVSAIQEQALTIVVDTNGSAVIEVIEKLFPLLSIKPVGVYTTIGKFERVIEPTVETLKHLVPIIDESSADFGCGFDADADRVEIVISSNSVYAKQHGPMVSGNYVLALGIDAILGRTKTKTPVVVNTATSPLIQEVVAKYDTELVYVDVGEINVVNTMKELQSVIGGEGSNGGIIEGSTTCRDGIVSLVLIASQIAACKQSLDELLLSYPHYYEERYRGECLPEQTQSLAQQLIAHFKEQGYTVLEPPSTVRGFRVQIDEHTMLFCRPSATEPGLFRIIANGREQQKVSEAITLGKQIFTSLA